MKKLCIMMIAVLGLSAQAANEIGYIETFSLAEDRADALKQLIPGTRDYYYYHCLHFQNTGQREQYDAFMAQFIKRHRYTARVKELRNRQALIDYDKNAEGALDHIRSELGIQFNHRRKLENEKSSAPTKLDPKTISTKTLKARALSRYKNTEDFENGGLELLAGDQLSDTRRRDLLHRLQRPDYPGLVDLVVADLKVKDSRGFGHHSIHANMLKGQLEALLKEKPDLKNNHNYVRAYMSKLRPGNDVQIYTDDEEREAYYERLWAYVKTLDPVHNSLKANVLYHRLRSGQSLGRFDHELFMEYIKLPRNVHYVNRKYYDKQNHNIRVNLGQRYDGITPAAVRNDEPLVMEFLAHFFVKAKDFKAYEPYISDIVLNRVFATTKILSGDRDVEKWASMLSPSEYKSLKDRVDLDFVPWNKKQFDPNDPVSLELHVKNVKDLIVKVFDINTLSYYREQTAEINLAINLDGLVATHETRVKYAEAPDIRKLRKFDFPQLRERGVYVVEFIGNGKSSRALIQKGRLRYVSEVTSAGHAINVLDEANRHLKDAQIWIGSREYEPNESGEILVPFSTRPGKTSIVLRHGEFASRAAFDHKAEAYQLHTGFYADREALLKRRKAQVLVRPVLRVSGMPTSLKLLEEVTLVISSTDALGVTAQKEITDFKLFEGRESVYEFSVPERLRRIHFTLRAKVKNISRNKKDDVAASASFALNQIDQTVAVDDIHVTFAGGHYIVEHLGKNGETKKGRPIYAEFKHRHFKNRVHVSLQTDENGRCHLGALGDISWFTLRGADKKKHTWRPRQNRNRYAYSLHGIEGEALQVPFGWETDNPKDSVSLLALVGNTFQRDRSDAISFKNGFMELKGLVAGDFDLFIKPIGERIKVRIAAGVIRDGYALSKNRLLQVPKLKPLAVAGLKTGAKEIELKLANATPFTRVHVVASRYVADYDLYNALNQSGFPGLLTQIRLNPMSFFESGRKIGDEYRYILDRQYAKKYPGNMLTRPGLLLNPWAIRKTEAGKEELRQDQAYRGAGNKMGAAAAGGEGAGSAGAGGDVYSNLDFLKDQSVILANVKPDENGVVKIDRKALGSHANVRIVAVDPQNALSRELSLKDTPLETDELRLILGLDPKKKFAEQKLVSVVEKARPFTIADVTTSQMESYDTLARVFNLYSTLSGNSTLTEFSFILNWPELKEEDKREKYAKYACHELHFFLFHKDPEFFKAVIGPYLKNKKDKTFMDHWLLGDELARYVEPWAFQRLNIVERILLGRRIQVQRPSLARHVRELSELIPLNIEDFNHRFDTAIKSSALDGGGDFHAASTAGRLALRNQKMKNLHELSDVSATLSAGISFDEAPAMEAAPPMASKPMAKKSASRRLSKSNKGLDKNDEKSVGGRDEYFFKARGESRDRLRRHFQKLDKTEELVENNYYRLPIEQQLAGLVVVNAFWNDYAAHAGDGPFLSKHVALATRNFTEMMLALAVLDVPFKSGESKSATEGVSFSVTVATPMVVFHQEIREGELAKDKTPILVSQNFFRADDRYRFEGNERYEKYIADEFLQHVVYGCQVILTNPNANRQKLSVLLQIPKGALPVNNGFYTKGRQVTLEPYATTTMDYFFYFPAVGKFAHYPVHVAKNEKLVANADPFVFTVVAKLSKIDKTSWAWISQNGTDKQVFDFLDEANLNRINLDDIAWRVKDKAFFEQATRLLGKRLHYAHTLWSYAFQHNHPARLSEYLAHSPYADRVGDYIDTALLTVDPVARHRYQHMEYAPLVNPRAHQVGQDRTILNHRFRQQYQRLAKVLSYRAKLDDADELAVAYYLLLQDRIEEGLKWFGRVDLKNLTTRLQYDYAKTFVSFYEENLDQAKALAKSYEKYPVPRWRNKFGNVLNQLKEAEGGAAIAADGEDRDQTQSQLASTEPRLDFKVEAKEIRFDYGNMENCTVNFYPMDIELLFSRKPFIQDQSAQFSYIQPVQTSAIRLPGDKQTFTMKLPEKFHNSNVMVEVVAGGIRKSQAYYANAMTVQVIENYGQVKVTHVDTKKPLSKVYVKVYGRSHDGGVKFFKDGYTDFRGRFDYVSLNTNEIDNTAKLALLILSEEHGAVIREAKPPKR